MRIRNLLGLVSLVSAGGLMVAACGSSGTDASGGDATAGPAGPGAGGKSTGAGGSTGGKGGAAGAGGQIVGAGGTAGAGTGGAAGKGGSSAGGSAGAGTGGSAGGATGTGGSAGTGTGVCSATQLDCDKKPANGCESDTTTDPANCGKCGMACAGATNASGACVGSKCLVSCNTGFAACTGKPADGCSTKTDNDPKNCGECGHVCPSGPNGTAACTNGACTLACAANFGNCNNDPSDGCESDLMSDPMNCNSCNTPCDGPCNSGACACAGTSASAKAVPLDIYIMLDKSGSMNTPVMGANTRWQVVTGALQQFFSDPSTTDTSVALQYFPLQGPATPVCSATVTTKCTDPNGTSCDTSYYYSPAVPMGALPGNANSQVTALTTSLTANSPLGGTPTNVSLTAALKYAADWKAVVPNDAVIVVLVTDGQPADGCSADINNSAAAALAGFSGNPPIPTYVIGVGSEVMNLDSIAMSGGTGTAFVVNDGDATAFIQKLKDIKKTALGCSYTIPKPANGTIDFSKVNVQYTPGGGTPMIINNVGDKSMCGAGGGWYYDNSANPTQIILCDSTCATLQMDSGAKVDIVLGCATKKE